MYFKNLALSTKSKKIDLQVISMSYYLFKTAGTSQDHIEQYTVFVNINMGINFDYK